MGKIGIIMSFVLWIGFSPAANGQNAFSFVHGRVKDTNGAPVQFAHVYVKGETASTQTDAKGEFRLRVMPGTHIICIRSMGYETQEQQVEVKHERNILHVTLRESTQNLDEVLVEAKSPVRRVNESAYNVVAIDAVAMQNTTLDLAHAMEKVSGVKIRESGGLGSDSRFSLNGFTGRHVKFFMDGVPMEGMGSSFRINNIPIALAERIEVYKGVVPVGFGADAIGGAVNIVTNQRNNTYVDASYSYGSFNTHKSTLCFGHTSKAGFLFRFNAYQNYSDNSYRIKTRLLNLETNTYTPEEYWFERFHDNYHNEAVVAQTGLVRKAWADRLLFGITLSREKADIQNANLMKIVYGGRERRAYSVIPSLNYDKRNLLTPNLNLSLTANYSIAHNNNTDTLARQYNWKGEYRAKSVKGEGQYSMGEYDNKNATAIANLTYRIGDKHHFTLNNLFGSYSRKASDAVANTETATAATFMRRTNAKNVLGLSYRFEPFGSWNTSAFLKRYDVLVRGPVDVSTTTTAVYEEQDRSFNVTGYGIATTYHLTSALQVKASFEQAYRLPTENELFGDEVLETGDMSLKPENSRNLNFNISVEKTLNDVHSLYIDAGLIYRDTRDYIRRQIEQRYGGAFYTNHGKVRNLGADLEARYFYKKAFSVGGNFTYQDIRNMERYAVGGRELIYYKDRMPNVPYLFGNVDANCSLFDFLGKKRCVLSVGYNLRYVHAFFRDWESEGGDIIIPRQLSHDISLTCSLHNGRYNIVAEVKNLADEMLYDNYSLQKPGRSFSFKLRYFFFKT